MKNCRQNKTFVLIDKLEKYYFENPMDFKNKNTKVEKMLQMKIFLHN